MVAEKQLLARIEDDRSVATAANAEGSAEHGACACDHYLSSPNSFVAAGLMA
jgi:hypothetical protein